MFVFQSLLALLVGAQVLPPACNLNANPNAEAAAPTNHPTMRTNENPMGGGPPEAPIPVASVFLTLYFIPFFWALFRKKNTLF